MKRAPLVVLLLCLAACGGVTPPTASSSSAPAGVSVTLLPATLAALADPDRPFDAEWVVLIQETGGIGGAVDFVNATVRDADSGAQALPTGIIAFDATTLAAIEGTTRVSPLGAMRVPQGLRFALARGGQRALVSVAVQFTDDHGNVLSATAQTVVQ